MLENLDDDNAVTVRYSPAWCTFMGNALVVNSHAFKAGKYKKRACGVKVNKITTRSRTIEMPTPAKTILSTLVQHLENKTKARQLANHLNIHVSDIWMRPAGYLAVDIINRIFECYYKKFNGIFELRGQVLFRPASEENQDNNDVDAGYGPDGMQRREDLDADQEAYLVEQDQGRQAALDETNRRRQRRADRVEERRQVEEEARRLRAAALAAQDMESDSDLSEIDI
jgi:hypothetical protein